MNIGIAGGTASGKTMVAQNLGDLLERKIVIIGQDSYYLDQAHLPMEQRAQVNYDHPDAFDVKLLVDHIESLNNGKAIEMPVWDYAAHCRAPQTIHVDPAPVVVVEGILVLAIPALRDMMNVKIFVDTDADVRVIRRLSRDIRERGRTVQSVMDQYMSVVRLMHLEFVEPSKRYADIIIPRGGDNSVAIDFIVTKIRTLLD